MDTALYCTVSTQTLMVWRPMLAPSTAKIKTLYYEINTKEVHSMSNILLSDNDIPSEVCQALRVLDKHLVNVNRVEVIDARGRSYVNLNVVALGIGLQDGMDTVKLFLEEE